MIAPTTLAKRIPASSLERLKNKKSLVYKRLPMKVRFKNGTCGTTPLSTKEKLKDTSYLTFLKPG